MRGRRPVFKRTKNFLVLQQRDEDILKTAYKYGFLVSEQIKDLCGFLSLKRTNDRLRKLYDNGFLSRRLFVNRSKKSILYFIGPKAMELLVNKTGIDPAIVRKKRLKLLKMKETFLSHFLSVNNFRYSLEVSAKSGICLDVWKSKPALFLEEDRKIFPDAYFRFICSGTAHHCFLLIDRSSESGRKIKKKVEAYLDFCLTGECAKQFGFQYFRLLIVCRTLKRASSLARTIEKTTDKSFCWLTVEECVVPHKILTNVWFRPNQKGGFSLTS